MIALAAALLATPLPAVAPATAQDAARGLKDPDVVMRLVAVDQLAEDPDPKAERALQTALRDEDWEVVERAAAGLASHGTSASTGALLEVALECPVGRIRRAAARTLGASDAEAAVGKLLRKLSGRDALRAAEALAELLSVVPETKSIDLGPLERVVAKGKDPAVRASAARALVAGSRADRPAVVARVLQVHGVAVPCAALEASAASDDAALVPVLVDLLAVDGISDLVERRAIDRLGGLLVGHGEEATRPIASLLGSRAARAAARGARIVERLASGDGSSSLLQALQPVLEHREDGARAAAVHALAAIGGGEAAEAARRIGAGDRSARVRLQAVAAAGSLDGASEETVRFLVERLATEADLDVRIEAAVQLGRKGNLDAVGPLVRAFEDPAWEVAACAAVSLGKTREVTALEPLARVAEASEDWRLRGAAIAGLTNLYQKSAVDRILPALADPDPCVARTAHAYLVATTNERLPPDVETWRTWWAANRDHVYLVDPETAADWRARFTDAKTAPAQVFRDKEIVVLESRGDHIETLLAHEGIEHRTTIAGHVGEAGLHPDALFVSNCTGEIEADDVQRLRWFVLTGGRLFASCWALTETIDRALPGVLGKHETRDEVLDEAPAEPATVSPYTEGVFGPEVRPLYALQGAHLIEVLDPERAEVLVDSPECADRWGAGDLAAWFRAGHGVVLDSVNHFDVQGLELATGLKTRVDRQAYAVDHMGLTYAELRATRDAPYWGNSLRASEQVRDLSVLRIVTNFVRIWRSETGR